MSLGPSLLCLSPREWFLWSDGERGGRTGQFVDILSAAGFVSPAGVADELVAGGEEDDAEEGEEEGERAGYAPGGEDDAEIVGREGEEHLVGGC